MNETHHADGDLANKLSEQADLLRQLSREASAEQAIPSVFSLRDRSLQQRETRARRTSYLASSALVLTVLGWGWQGLKAVDTHSPALELRTVAAGSDAQTSSAEAMNGQNPASTGLSDDQRIYARWWEPVAVEWVDEEGHSLGFAGYVAEERTSWIDPRDQGTGPKLDGNFASVSDVHELTIEEPLLEPAF